MEIQGGCYCGGVRYEAKGDPLMRAMCFCRECQHVNGGGETVVMGMPEAGFSWTKGQTKGFKRKDLENGVTREFCPECGTHMVTRAPGMPGAVLVKIGTFDDPTIFGKPDMAIFCGEKQGYHAVPEGTTAFDRVPGG